MLYEDVGIVASVMELRAAAKRSSLRSELPAGNYRLFQMDPLAQNLLKSCDSYDSC